MTPPADPGHGPGSDPSSGADPGGTDFEVGGLTPEQRRTADEMLRAQHVDATWTGTTVRGERGDAPQVHFVLDRVRRGVVGGPGMFAPPGAPAPPPPLGQGYGSSP